MALNFNDANSERVDIGNPSVLNFGSGDLTIMAWVNTTAPNNHRGNVIGKGSGFAGGKRYRLHFDNKGGSIQVEIDDDNPDKILLISATVQNDGNWHHAVGVRDGNNLRLYIDGAEDANSPVDITGYGDLDNTRPAQLGSSIDEPSGDFIEFWDGDIDDGRYYGRALSPAEIATIFASKGHDGIVDDLRARFTFMEKAPGVTASGSDVKDIGPNSLATTSINTPTYSEGELAFRRRIA